ncbi:hypothetical protein HanRHA438_Chr13g0629741 [Helianthus annuus]|nr:hypothetical protein HanRHA438_Chr13g0629741 [Helianthus annuus]
MINHLRAYPSLVLWRVHPHLPDATRRARVHHRLLVPTLPRASAPPPAGPTLRRASASPPAGPNPPPRASAPPPAGRNPPRASAPPPAGSNPAARECTSACWSHSAPRECTTACRTQPAAHECTTACCFQPDAARVHLRLQDTFHRRTRALHYARGEHAPPPTCYSDWRATIVRHKGRRGVRFAGVLTRRHAAHLVFGI